MRFGAQNYESFVEIEGKISRNWIHIKLLRINFFGRTREMNLAGVSEDFGPHSRSVVLLRLPDFFFTKNFSGRIFFLEQGTEFFYEPRKIFGRKFCLGFRMTKADFFCLMPSRIFQKTEKEFFEKRIEIF